MGYFISIEGIDGSGKTTQAKKLASYLEAEGFDCLALREPGGTAISEQIRAILLNPENEELSDVCEMLLMESSRAQLVDELILPALDEGKVVICDRYADSTYAYQHGGRGLDSEMVLASNEIATGGLKPDLSIYLDILPELAYERAIAGGKDRLEEAGFAFQKRVYAAYEDLLERESERFVRIDATVDEETIFAQIKGIIDERLFSCLEEESEHEHEH